MAFLWPAALILLAVLAALVVGIVLLLRRRRPRAVRYSSLSLVLAASPGSSRLRRHLPFALFVLGLASLVVALARPVAVVSVPSGQTSIILAMDVSRSMCSTDIPPSRLIAAKDAASGFIQRQDATTRMGIVAFAGFGQLVQAPTSDTEALLDAVASLTTGRRTAIGSGILSSIDAIAEIDPNVAPAQTEFRPGVEVTPVAPGAYVPDIIVLLTDGANNVGPEPVDAAQQAADRGIRVYTIGFGTEAGAGFDPECAPEFVGREPPGGQFGGGGGPPGGFRRGIDEDTLKQVATLTGGTYEPAESADQLDEVFKSLPTYLISKSEVTELSVAFVGLGALLTILGLWLSQRWRPLP